jgi:hypothetical protein
MFEHRAYRKPDVLGDLAEQNRGEERDHLSRLQNGHCAHASAHQYGLGAHELAFEPGFSILEQELDDFDKIPVEFIE